MKANNIKEIIDNINVPEDKLNHLFDQNNKPNKSKKYYRFTIVILATVLLITMMNFSINQNKDKSSQEDAYFICDIYANDQEYSFDDTINIELDNDVFDDYWKTTVSLNESDGKYYGSSYIPFDITIKGENIKEIHFQKVTGDNLSLCRYISGDLFDEDYLPLEQSNQVELIVKQLDELRSSDLSKLNNYCSDETDLRKFMELARNNRVELITNNYKQSMWKDYGWPFWVMKKNSEKISYAYSKQEIKDYRNGILVNFVLTADQLEELTDADYRMLTINELLTCKVKLMVEYNNGIIKEKTITFNQITNQDEKTVSMQIA